VCRGGIKEEHTASWFSHDNPRGNESREKLAQDSLEMLIQWLKEGGNVGIHGVSLQYGSTINFISGVDATNSTQARR